MSTPIPNDAAPLHSRQPLRIVLAVKRILAYLAMHPIVGMLVSRVFQDDIPFHGMRIDVRGAGVPHANKAALALGIYESAEYRFVRDHLLSELPVIELGSSIGAVSSAIARRLLCGQRLICVEANPQLTQALTRNVNRHASHLDAHVVHAAVCYDADCVRFAVSDNNLMSAMASGDGKATVVEVPAVTLASITGRFPGEPFQLVADIEGAELELFEHDIAALSLCRLMIVELHETRRKGKTYTRDFLEAMIVDAGFIITARYGSVVVCRRV